MTKFLNAVCLWVIVAESVVAVTAQSGTRTGGNPVSKAAVVSDGQQVVVEKDEFSGATTVKLKPQKLMDTPEHQVTYSAEAKISSDAQQSGFSEIDDRVQVKIVSLSKRSVDFGDEKIYFLADGERITGPTAGGYDVPLPGARSTSPLRTRYDYTSGLSLTQLRQLVRSKRVQMRLGSIETTLSPDLLSKLNEFVRRYDQAKGKA